MSKISLAPDASGTGIFTIASPNSNTNRTLTLPDDTGTIVTNSGNQAGSFTTLNTSGQVVFNDAGADVDFRVEGDTDANLLFVDASADAVGIGTNAPINELTFGPTTSIISPDTTDGSDSKRLRLCGGGAASVSRGSYVTVYGNEYSGAEGELTLVAGDAVGGNIVFYTGNAVERMRIDSSGQVIVGPFGGNGNAVVAGSSSPGATNQPGTNLLLKSGDGSGSGFSFMTFSTSPAGSSGTTVNTAVERARITSGGGLAMVKTDPTSLSAAGFAVDVRSGNLNGVTIVKNDSNFGTALWINRLAAVGDGTLVEFAESSTVEGSISVSGTTVSYNGGHLSRWAQMLTKPELFKGTVMSNLDEMNVYVKPTLYWTEEDELPVDEEGNPTVAVGDLKQETSVSENEQLNKVKVSDVEGDPNVAGVFVNWTYDEAHQVDEINMAMTGDMIIRIAEGVTVARGDLLMSAGDGTAKPQGDDIVRSKTIAKVTSTHVTCTYEDGSYCVPCVLMAC
jgi:hypothetical protein